MKKLFLYFILLILVCNLHICFADDDQATTVYNKSINVGNDKIRIVVEIKKFDPNSKNDSMVPCPRFGDTPPGKPKYLIKRFDVIWNQKHLKIPKNLYQDIYDPVLYSRLGWWDDLRGIQVVPGSDANSILIEMKSKSSECRNYKVWWVIRKDGNHMRFIDDSMP